MDAAKHRTSDNARGAEGVSDALPVGTELGDYTILRVLGQGGFGVTYLAHDAGLDQDVVVKENLPTQFAGRGGDSLTVTSRGGAEGQESFSWATQRFLDEARLLAKLNHPNIVRVLRAFSSLGTAYYVMPWVGGKDLKHYAEEHGVEQPFLEGVLRQLLPALSYLHSNNLLHRDIKPGNILCTEDGKPVLIDFGTARAMVSERSQTMVESAGYTPIEQMQSHGNTGPWTDLYALGATMYRLIAGEVPPRSTDRIGKTDSYVPLAGRAELQGKFSAVFLAGIDRALAVWPEDRWQSAGDWGKILPRIVEQPAVEENDSPKMPAGDNVSLGGEETPSAGKQVQAPTGRKASGKGRVLAHAVVYLVLISCAVYTGWFYYDAHWSPHALYSTGFRHERGAGVPQDQAKAVEFYRRAAEGGHPLAQDALGLCCEQGKGLPVDCAEAAKWYRMAAEQGNEHAQTSLGRIFAEGDGVPCDMKEAAKWSRMAADQGNVEAQCRLGMCYAEGRGVEKDSAAAAQWFRRAADQGCASAQAKLGDCFALGAGVARDTQEAVRLYRMAVDQGDDAAQVKLGDCYSQGEGVTGDKREAMWLYRRAAERGYAPAQVKLGDCYGRGEGTQRDTQEAVIWYRKADAQGNAQAQYNLGICYANGDGVPRKLEISASFFRKAAEQGHADAQCRLGICYEEGLGVARDLEAAVQWYHKAAGQGNADAQKALKRLGR